MIVCVCFCVSTTDTTLVSVNVGHCEDNNLILNETFVWYYQKAYVSMYVICLLVVIVLYVAVFAAVLRQRRKRQKRRRNQLAAAANTATTKSLTATQSHGVRRPLSSDSTEMATIIHSKADDAGVVDGAEVMVVSNEERQQPAAVQTSKFNLRCKAADQKGTKMKMISRKYCCWHKITTKSRIFNRCSNVEVQ